MMESYATPTRLIPSICNFIMDGATEIWIRRDQIALAEIEFQRQIADGKIISAVFRPEKSRIGSVNFLLEYPI